MPKRASRAKREEDWDDQDEHQPHWAMSLLRKAFSHPRKLIGPTLAATASAVVLVNALFLQKGPHPAPIFAPRPLPVVASETTGSVPPVLPRPRPADLEKAEAVPAPAPAPTPIPAPAAKPTASPRAAAPGPVVQVSARSDQTVHTLTANRRVLAIQHALSDFGYGPVNPTGIEDPATAAAIQKFERERKLPPTGQVSERLVHELARTTGRQLD